MSTLPDKDQDAICNYCEENIIQGSSLSQMFCCEGRYCTQAEEGLAESIEDETVVELTAKPVKNQGFWVKNALKVISIMKRK